MSWVAGILTFIAIGSIISQESIFKEVLAGAIFGIVFGIVYLISHSIIWSLILASVPTIAFDCWMAINETKP